MRIGIIIAMQKEFLLLKYLLQDPRSLSNDSGDVYTIGSIGIHEVILQQCGVGKVNAAVGTESLIHTFSPDLVISSGVAGGCRQDVRPLDIVICESTCYHDVWCGEDNALGQVQGMPPKFFCTNIRSVTDFDKCRLSAAHGVFNKSRLPTHRGLIVSGDWFVTTREKMLEILSRFPEAIAVDMETCAIAQVCHIRKTPFLSIRIISDNPLLDNQSQQYHDFWNTMAGNSFDFLKELLQNIPAKSDKRFF